MRILMTAGEKCPDQVAWHWSQQTKLFNVYGPAECTVVSTTAQLVPNKSVNIGTPLATYECHIVDPEVT